jgi:hypothetical protein
LCPRRRRGFLRKSHKRHSVKPGTVDLEYLSALER